MSTQTLPKTKIVATIGPACDSQEMIEKMIQAGVSVFRFNMKHGDYQWHSTRMERVKKAYTKIGRAVAILMDLQGPEVRIGQFKEGSITIKKGEKVYFTPEPVGKEKTIILDEKIVEKINPGQQILVADGFFEFQAIKKQQGKIIAEVIEGGVLGSKKNITLPGVNIDLPTLIERDLENISLAAKEDIDFVALSFVRNRDDIDILRKVLKEKNLDAQIIAKIEQQEAIKNFEEILQAADGIMVARGDLGVQLPMERVPYYQKLMIQRCQDMGKPVITATQMLESMIENPRPTRAEVNDVANAVYDGTDAVMLSAESASGKYPLRAVEAMVKITSYIEEKKEIIVREPTVCNDQTEAIALSVYNLINCYLAEDLDLKGIGVFTTGGKTARMISKLKPNLPVYAFTISTKVRDQLCLSWGITPFYIKPQKNIPGIPRKESTLRLIKEKLVKRGDKLILIYGSQWGTQWETNTIKIKRI